jgi:Ca2+-binding RTX toxin-like protein
MESNMQITKEQLKQWSACRDGYEWFLRQFPEGTGTYHDIVTALYADKRAADARWLSDNCYRAFGVAEFSPVELASLNAMAIELNSLEHPADSELCSSGYGAQIGSSGNGAQIGSSGNDARIGSSGYDARIGSSGNDARIGSSGNDAQIGSSGNDAQIEVTGQNAVVACAGSVIEFTLGEGGCIAVPYRDGTRTRFAVAYVGENGIDAGVKYRLNERHEFESVK